MLANFKNNRKMGSKARKKNRTYNLDHRALMVFVLAMGGITTVLIGLFLAWFISLDLPDVRTAADYKPLVATIILDRHGRPIDAVYKQYRIVLKPEEIDPLLAKAFVAAEDANYFEHPGLDIWSIVRAAFSNLRSGKYSQGGSTITQQVTRALMLSKEKSMNRKISEAILSYRLEKVLGKEQILAIYLNEIYLGEGAYGVEAASRVYFSKPSSQLNLAEIAMLAGLPQSPSRYSPLKNYKAARARQRYVLNRMAETGMVSPEVARKAWAYNLKFNHSGQAKGDNGYFSDYVLHQLKKKYGEEEIYHQGLTVWTTLDSRMQKIAQDTVYNETQLIGKKIKSRQPPQGALVVIDNKSGQIRALVGGNDYRKSSYNRAVSAKRQPGSAFKPLVYAAAFEKGISPGEYYDDSPLRIRNRDGSVWQPQNYSRTYAGAMRLSDALIHSNNIITIRLLQEIGVSSLINLAKRMGIHSELSRDLTLALGSSGVSLLELTGAYSVFANRGLYRPPVAIIKVKERDGKIKHWSGGESKQVLSPLTAVKITTILQEVIRVGTGQLAAGVRDAAGKTGTSNNNVDAWFIGYTPGVTTGVWIGHDNGASMGKNASGGQIAAPLWKDFMKKLP